MRQTQIVLVCDACGTERDNAGVETHRLGVDGQHVEVDLCARDWDAVRHSLTPILANARKVAPPAEPKRTRRRGVVLRGVAVDDQRGWTLTAHAIERIGQRGLDAAAVIFAAEHPHSSRPSDRLVEAELRERDGVKAVVIPQRRLIITAARSDADAARALDDALATA